MLLTYVSYTKSLPRPMSKAPQLLVLGFKRTPPGARMRFPREN